MSTLTILIIIVAGVAVAYLLEEWSERGGIGIVPRNWLGPAPKGSWTEPWPLGKLWNVAWFFVGLSLGVIAIVVEPAFRSAIVYAFLFIIFTFVGLFERKFPKSEHPYGFLAWHVDEEIIVVGIISGTAFLAVASLFFQMLGLAVYPYSPLFEMGIQAILSTYFLVVVAPFVEEAFIRGFLLPSFVERVGILGGILLSATFFAIVHLSFPIYAMSIPLAISAFLFSVPAGFLTLKYRTFSIALIMHLTYNIGRLAIAGGG